MSDQGPQITKKQWTGITVGAAVFLVVWLLLHNVALGIIGGIFAALAYGSRNKPPAE